MRVALLTVVVVVGVLVVILMRPSPSSAAEGVVQRVVDGDTLVISVDDKTERVRLLNVDTPETKHPGKAVECLGPEATEFTKRWARPGMSVALSFDEERRDPYGRLLAWVEDADGASLSEALAEAGLGMPAEYDDNVSFLPRVSAASNLAAEEQRGFFDPSVGCTAPAQVDKITSQIQTATQTPRGSSIESLAAPTAALAAAIATADRLLSRAASERASFAWSALPTHFRDLLVQRVQSSSSRATQRVERLKAVKRRMVKRIRAAERRREAALEREQAAREQAALEEAAREAAEEADDGAGEVPTQEDDRDDTYVPPAPDPLDGYTGPRCYAPGGKSWRPC